MSEKDEGRVAKLMRKLEKAVEEMYRWDVHMMGLFYSKPRMITIANNMGVIEGYEQIVNDDIPDQMQIYVKPGSSQDMTVRDKQEQAMQMFSSNQLDPITFFERMGFSNPDEQAEKLWKWQNGSLFNAPDVGPEQRARDAVQAILSGEDAEPDPEATLESIQIQAESLRDGTLPWTEDAIEKIEEKMQVEISMVQANKQKQRAEMQASRVPMDIAAQYSDVPQAAEALEQEAAQMEG
jgi:hypothetical protein